MMVGSAGGGTEEPNWSLDQVMIQIQQLVNSLAALQNMVHQQSAIIQQLQNQGPPATTGTTPRGPKMASLPLYDGSMASCKAFINACHPDQNHLGSQIYAIQHGATVTSSLITTQNLSIKALKHLQEGREKID
ncbi:hypothetical protein AMATHDRAFT_9299 [Amanita thiersii Skay4041]|uniref:Uncharacterized protein n=1 Tax=Amanita thiersii Skay4041 TaxID=703135 RepID=A0A2A9N8L4_9AGAR|nr:hypothetical protein AMATHDRAFT_9299 [Amanita thiersii Skay4041]